MAILKSLLAIAFFLLLSPLLLLRWIFRRISGEKETVDRESQEGETPLAITRRKRSLVVDADAIEEEEKVELYSTMAEDAGYKVHRGKVEHAYALEHVSDAEVCPRCGGPTLQEYASFVYATQIAPRAMFGPAGFFCTRCPTVIVDEDLIIGSINEKEFEFGDVVGIHDEEADELSTFGTWNGEPAVYVLDEEGIPLGLAEGIMAADIEVSSSSSRKKSRSFRRRIARESRKKNRRRKK